MLGTGDDGEDVTAKSSSDLFKSYDPDRLPGVLLDAQRGSPAKRPGAVCLTVDPKCSPWWLPVTTGPI